MTNSSRTRQPEAPQQRGPDAKAATDVVTEPEAAAGSAMPGTSGDGRAELPVLVPEVIRMPILSVRVAHVAVPHVSLPRPSGRYLWWGGLAGAAVLGVLDWPVAAALAIGSYVAEQRATRTNKAPDGAVAAGGAPSPDATPTGG
ncbi:MAG: hypothetical protein ACXV3F_09820 [Frankiaceae bacterium]